MLKKYQLSNGLTVILYPNHKAPVVSAQVWVNNGSADETKGVEGVSHFIEHLVFKGSDKYEVGDIARIVEASGGQLNAYTSFDQTVFYITLSKHFSDTALDMLSQMMGHPKFDEKEIDNEREVVIEEIKKSKDSISRLAMQNMFSSVYKKHPYGRPVIGYEKVIQKISKKKIVDYYQSHYSPSNMTLLIVGDFDIKEIKRDVKKYFEPIENYKIKKAKRTSEPEQSRPRESVVTSDFKETRLSMSWKTVNAKQKDTPALDVLAAVLGQYESSRFIQRLRVKDPSVNYIFCSSFTLKDKGLFTIQLGIEPEKFKTACDDLLEEIEIFLTESVTKEEIASAVNNFESDEIYTQQTVDGIANNIGQYMFLTGDPEYSKKHLKELKEISPKDLLRVFRKYLKPEKLSVSYVSNENEEAAKKKVKALIKDYKKVFQKVVVAKGIEKESPKYKKAPKVTKKEKKLNEVKTVKLKGGLEVLLLENHDVPLFHIQTAMLGGLRLEDDTNNGIGNLLSHVWSCGSDNLSEIDLSKRLEKNSIQLSSFSGRNTIGLRMTSLSRFQKEAMPLYLDVLLREKFDPQVIKREKEIIETSLRHRDDYPAQIAIAGMMSNLFKDHPYKREIEGSLDSLSNIGQSQLESFFKEHRLQKNTKVAVVGSFDEKQILSSLEEAFSGLSKGEILAKNFPVNYPKKEIVYRETLQKEQSHILLGYPGLQFKDKRKYTLKLIEAILAGQGGRLFLELRDKASLAYTVAPFHMEGIDAGCFAAYIACSPNKTDTAIKMLKEEFSKLSQIEVAEEELDRAKRYLIGKHDISVQKNSSIANHILFDVLYGREKNEYKDFAQLIEKITAKDIKILAKEIFSQPHVLSVVGPSSLKKPKDSVIQPEQQI